MRKRPKRSRQASAKRKVVPLSGLKREVTTLRKELAASQKLMNLISRGKYQWEATFDAIQDPVAMITKDFKIVRANLAYARLIGKDIKKLIGKTCHLALAGRRAVCAGCPVDVTFEAGSTKSGEIVEGIRAREYVVHAHPFRDTVDGRGAIVVHYRDVTEERRLQQELVQQEKMVAIGMLAGGVAHEINNPLGGIIAFSQLLKRDLDKESPIYADIEEIESAALRCKKIVHDLLDFSRASSGRTKYWVDVNPLIEKVIPFIKMELKSLNIHLETTLQPGIAKVYGDANRLQQVFLNLLTNACHAMQKGGRLGIKTYVEGEGSTVCVEVSDTGTGIAKEDRDKIFDPFFTTKRPGKGTGLGLSISYKIVKEHGGSIGVKSEVGRGSRFIVSFPSQWYHSEDEEERGLAPLPEGGEQREGGLV